MSTATTPMVRIDDPASFKAIQAIVWYIDNRPFATFWSEVFDKVEPPPGSATYEAGYAEGWRRYYQQGVGAVWGHMDRAHRNRLVAAALAFYGADLDAEILRVNGADPCEACGAPSTRTTDCGGGLTRWCTKCYEQGS